MPRKRLAAAEGAPAEAPASCTRATRGRAARRPGGLRLGPLGLRAPLDPVAAHLVVDARPVDAEPLGRLALVAARTPERLRDRELLDLLERQVGGDEGPFVVAAAVQLRRQVLRPELLALPEHHRALDRVLEL